MNTYSTELPVIVLHLWDRGSRDVEETLFKASVYSYMYVCIWSEIFSCIESYYNIVGKLDNLKCAYLINLDDEIEIAQKSMCVLI